MTGRVILLAAMLALLAVLVEWRLVGGEGEESTAEAERPGYYLNGIDLEDFGTDGKMRLGLTAATAVEEPVSGTVTLREVVVDYHAVEGQSWHLTSAEAHVPRGGDAVEFLGDVRMSGKAGNQPGLGELRTAHLTFDTSTEHAGTRDPVTLAFGRHLMYATGMQVDLKAGKLRLESEVHGLFTP